MPTQVFHGVFFSRGESLLIRISLPGDVLGQARDIFTYLRNIIGSLGGSDWPAKQLLFSCAAPPRGPGMGRRASLARIRARGEQCRVRCIDGRGAPCVRPAALCFVCLRKVAVPAPSMSRPAVDAPGLTRVAEALTVTDCGGASAMQRSLVTKERRKDKRHDQFFCNRHRVLIS